MTVNRKRMYGLNKGTLSSGPILYWMIREQRVHDNWGLLHARALAADGRPLVVVFCLPESDLGVPFRQYAFMLEGLKEVERELAEYRIPFVLLCGDVGKEVARFGREIQAGAVVTDFAPLTSSRQWQHDAGTHMEMPLIEVDGHNVVPARFVSGKQEYAARTIRPKIYTVSHEFLEDFSAIEPPLKTIENLPPANWDDAWNRVNIDRSVPKETAARAALSHFVNHGLDGYAARRNDPNAEGTSRLSAFFHFGQLSPQRAALTVAASGKGDDQASYLEELIIRRELSDNFCLYNPNYDSLQGAAAWARSTLDEHRNDRREYLYSYEEFEQAQTHSSLWNAAQLQLLKTGFMHGYMRMFWAKKILEWSSSPEQAHAIALRINDRYQLDGRDPNGYVGVLWSVAGLHDRAWKMRPIYGSIRYMNENGCRRKFDVDGYCRQWL